MTKKWIKLWVAESLRGTIRFDLTSEERGVWFDLLAMAADGRHESFIAPNTERGYPDAWIAATLNISLKLLQRVITKCEKTNRIERTPFGLHITNWTRYQSEYDRQKPYRQKQPGPPPDFAPDEGTREAIEDTKHLDYSYEMFCSDFDILESQRAPDERVTAQKMKQHFTSQYGWTNLKSKGARYCKLFSDTLEAVKANDESNLDNPDDEQVAKEKLLALQG